MEEIIEVQTLSGKIETFLSLTRVQQIDVMNETLVEADLIEQKINKSSLENETKTKLLSSIQPARSELQKSLNTLNNYSVEITEKQLKIISTQMLNLRLQCNIANEAFLQEGKTLLKNEITVEEIPEEVSASRPFTAGQILVLTNIIILLLVFAAIAVAVAFIPVVGPLLAGLAVAASKFIGFTVLTTALTTTATAITLPFIVAGVGAAATAGALLVVDGIVAIGLGIKNRMSKTLTTGHEVIKDEVIEYNLITTNLYQDNTLPCRVNLVTFVGENLRASSPFLFHKAERCYLYLPNCNAVFVIKKGDQGFIQLKPTENCFQNDIDEIILYFPKIKDENIERVTATTLQVNRINTYLVPVTPEDFLKNAKTSGEESLNKDQNKSNKVKQNNIN